MRLTGYLASLSLVSLAMLPFAACSEDPAAETTTGAGAGAAPPDGGLPDTGSPDTGSPDAGVPRFELIGHSDLGARGMNAALALVGSHVYVGSRTEGATHDNAGVLIVDATDPAAPVVVGEIGPPDEALLGVSSRELRAVPDKDLLIVLNFACSTQIHECSRSPQQFPATGGVAEADNLKFYDVSSPTQPVLVATHDFGSFPGNDLVKPHELFLWRDPADSDRILLYVTLPSGPPGLQVLDISDLADIQVVAAWDAQADGALEEPNLDAFAHSVSVSDDGAIAYLAYNSAGFFMVDTSEIAAGGPAPAIQLLTPIAQRVDYVPPEPVGTHSAIPIPNRGLVLLTDEVYSPPVHDGCPWGWARLVDVADPTQPAIVSEFKLAENRAENCPAAEPFRATFTAHNPTVTENLILVTWHAGGLVAVDTTDPLSPVEVTAYRPEPLASVALEDPMFQGNPVAMWSYPVIKDGLIYVVDVRNGLYILRYQGPYQEQIDGVSFLEGNSNLR